MKTQAFKTLKILFLLGIGLFAFSAQANYNTNYYTTTTNYGNYYGASACNFSRDLWQGMTGEDVRCLQQYLKDNAGGMNFVYPDGIFGSLTRQAVMNWQMSYGIPASGIFDSFSRSKYFELTGGGYGGGDWSWNFGNDSYAQKATNKINEALEMIQDAEDEIDDSDDDTSSAEDSLEDAKDDMIDAVTAFFVDRDFREAFDKADDAFQNAEDAFDDAGGSSGDKEDARDAINDAQDAIDDARDEINYAEDNGADVDDAWDTLDDAENKLEDAEDEYDDKDYDDAEDLANDAEDLADDAVDDIDW